jgi:hypothetical protein
MRIASVTVDCVDALVVGRFWSAALGRPLDPRASGEFASIGMAGRRDTDGWHLDGDETWLFVRVPEPKVAKNRLHLDLAAADPDAEVRRLVDLGATKVADVEEWGYRWTVLQDPEGNEFCVARAL